MNSNDLINLLLIVVGVNVITLLYVFMLFKKLSKINVENGKITEIAGFIKQGANAFIKREYLIVLPFSLGVALILFILGYVVPEGTEGVGLKSAICFIVGTFFSGLAGFVGMKAATMCNYKTTSYAQKEGMSGALRIAFSGGSILGLSVASLGLLGLTVLFILINKYFSTVIALQTISGYGLGCSFIALFGRVGGGIYTKAADVGADLVGKVEKGIPEDDHRNPAVIADNVGDNVGDIAGMGSDLCESYVGALISSLSLTFIAAVSNEGLGNLYILFVFLIASIGVLASLLSAIFVRAKNWKNPSLALSIASYISSGIVLLGSFILSIVLLKQIQAFFAVLSGLVVGIFLGKIAEFYTSSDYQKVKEVASQSQTGHATNIIAGLGCGMQSTGLTIIALVVGIAFSYFVFGIFGISLAAVGMLSTVGIMVSVDGYGPIADNAGGIAEMSSLDEDVRKITDKLDSVGNTTAAIGKGFCIGSAALTSVSLFVAFAKAGNLEEINIISPPVIIGLLVGAMLPYVFTSLTIKSVGKAANKMIEEVRRQYREHPEILEDKYKPDYAKCVDISTTAALKEMILPSLIALLSPIICVLILGLEGLGGLLVGGLSSAIMLAVFMANSGGAWDNAKKYIEDGNFGGKGSETHKASVTGDTVGDPLKDTAGPAMDILIKLMSIISLILAPVMVNYTSLWEIFSNLFK